MKKTEKIEVRLSHEEKTALTELAIAVGGFFAGHLATYFIAKSHSYTPIYSFEVRMGSDGVSIPILAKDGEIVSAKIPSKEGNVRVEASVSDVPESLQTATIKLCRETEADCQAIANPILKFNPNQHSALSFKDTNGQEFYVRLAPTIPARNPPPLASMEPLNDSTSPSE